MKYDLKSKIRGMIPNGLVNYFYHLPKAMGAVLYYGYPASKLKVIGITGTDGKTTTANLIYEILTRSHKKTALISTVNIKMGDKEIPTQFHVTSPDPRQVQKMLKKASEQNYEYVVLEASSHGLAQFRLWGCNFYMGIVTNITHDHLDYHGNFKAYLKAKANLIKSAKIAILNRDDDSFSTLTKYVKNKLITYGAKKGDFNLTNYPFTTSLLGDFNRLNCLAAIACAKQMGIEDKIIKSTISSFRGIKGRMEEINYGQPFKVYIDFASTVNGLKNALQTLKKLPHQRLIAVFGCAGLRDINKRPLMGKISCSIADIVVLTAEDPRTENVLDIIKQIKSGCEDKNKIIIESDRNKAINLAIVKLAKKNDIVGFFGKGHEQSMCMGSVELPWSEHKVVKEAILRRLKSHD